MGSFTTTKTADPSLAAQNAGNKINLNFGGGASKTVEDMAAATLEAGGYIGPPPREPKIGGKMPDGTVYAGVSPDTGNAMYATPADAPLTYTFNEAQEYAMKLDAHSYEDWRVPTKNELNVIFNNRGAIGGFNANSSGSAGWYCSASEDDKGDAWTRCFSDGDWYHGHKNAPSSLRCVR